MLPKTCSNIREMCVPSMTDTQNLGQWARILVYFFPFAVSIQLKSVADGFLLLPHSLPTWEILLWGHFHLCLKAVTLYSQKNNSLFGSVYSSVPYPWCYLGAFCLKWAFIKELTGISVTSNKSLSTVSIRLTLEVSLKKPDLKDLL